MTSIRQGSVTIRTAILQAADHIEAHPSALAFFNGRVPDNISGDGCPLAWVGFFFGMEKDKPVAMRSHRMIQEMFPDSGYKALEAFFRRMDEFLPERLHFVWANNAKVCAKTLRKYADKYHPELTQPTKLDSAFVRFRNKLFASMGAYHGA